MLVQLTHEWVKRAEEDYIAALDLDKRRHKRVSDIVCYRDTRPIRDTLKQKLLDDGWQFIGKGAEWWNLKFRRQIH